MRKVSTYHMVLRSAALSLAIVVLFDSGIVSPLTKQLADSAEHYLANAVGATASVSPTEINTLTAEITKQKQELDAREAALSEREISVGLTSAPVSNTERSDISTYILSILLFIILVLIVLNYALDFARARRLMFVELHESR